jgi:hypothetical protein
MTDFTLNADSHWYTRIMNGITAPAIWYGKIPLDHSFGVTYLDFVQVSTKTIGDFFCLYTVQKGIIMQSSLVFSKNLHKTTIHYTKLAV